MTKSLDISFDTSELLYNAEKLVDEVEKKLFKVNCDITNFQLDDDSCLDGSELYIRDIVNTKFKEINRNKIPANNNYWCYENHIKCQPGNYELQKINKSTFRNDIIRKSSRDIKISHEPIKNDSKNVKLPQPKKYFKKGNLNTIDILTRSSQSSVMPSLKLDTLPNETNIVKGNNDYFPELKINSCKRKKKNENSIDTAVQTSFQELPNDKLPDLLNKSSESFIAKNISNSSLPSCKIKSAINTDKSNHKEISKNNLDQQVLNDNKKSKRSFIEFICQIAELEINNSSEVKSGDFIKENQNDFNNNKSSDIEIINNDFNRNKTKLNSREYKDVDERLNNLDIKIKNIVENTSKLDDQFRCYNNRNHIDFKINSKSNKRDNNFDGVKFPFKPRSRISSSEIIITSETFKSPERFSTPLNNCNYIDIPVNVDTNNTCNDVEELSTSITKFDVNNDSKVFITRNKFSLSTAIENSIDNSYEIIVNEKSKIEFCLLETQKEINNKIHSDKDNDFPKNYIVKKSYCEQDAKNNHCSFNSSNVNNKNTSGNNEKKEFESKKSSISNEKELLESVRSQENIKNNNRKVDKTEDSGKFEKNNPTIESSKDDLRDRTSFDVSAIYSESFEAASLTEVESTLDEHKEINDGKIENFQLHKNDDTKLQANVLINREENTIHETTIVEDSKNELKNRERTTLDIKSISVSENTKKKNNIDQSKNSNLSIQSLTEKNENRKEFLSMYSLPSSYKQIQKNTPSVQTFTEEKGKSSTNDYSEGEFYLPISYSLGEIITITTSSLQGNENLNYYQNLTDGLHDTLNFQSFVDNIIQVGQEMSYTVNQQ
ncbi:myb-like protein D [Microplitis mediator]|uniref:myb-like protein D n=1 Tax=Microplitis mediator TaxID=375433 RepID=UPI00255762F5|nr:myb-like protein D [Microplitis mediator]